MDLLQKHFLSFNEARSSLSLRLVRDVLVTPQVILAAAVNGKRKVVAAKHAARIGDHLFLAAFPALADDFVNALCPDLLSQKHEFGVHTEERLKRGSDVEHLAEGAIHVDDPARLILHNDAGVQIVDERRKEKTRCPQALLRLFLARDVLSNAHDSADLSGGVPHWKRGFTDHRTERSERTIRYSSCTRPASASAAPR
jgi:hypothetical protein